MSIYLGIDLLFTIYYFIYMINEEFMVIETQTEWHPRLPLDLSLGEDSATLCQRYDLTPSQLQSLLLTPAFQKDVDRHRQDILDNGLSFRLKAKIMAEEYLKEIDNLVHDPEASPAVRLDAIKSIVKWSGNEPKESAAGGSTRMVIQWGDSNNTIAIETP